MSNAQKAALLIELLSAIDFVEAVTIMNDSNDNEEVYPRPYYSPQHAQMLFVEIEIGGLKIPGINAVSSQFSNEVILGRDVLNHLIVTLNSIESRTEIS